MDIKQRAMRQLIGRKLAPLASLAAQRRFILRATYDAYYLPEELLENAADAVRLGASTEGLSTEAKGELVELGRLLHESAPDLSSPEFITTDSCWCALRVTAQRCLLALGFDLASWESEELSPGSGSTE